MTFLAACEKSQPQKTATPVERQVLEGNRIPKDLNSIEVEFLAVLEEAYKNKDSAPLVERIHWKGVASSLRNSLDDHVVDGVEWGCRWTSEYIIQVHLSNFLAICSIFCQ